MATRCCSTAAASSGADEFAHIRLAIALDRGDHGFRKSVSESMRVLQRGAEKKFTMCMVLLGLFRLRSSATGDAIAGMFWLTSAAKADNAFACMMLGIAFADTSELPECFTACAFAPRALHTMADKSDSIAKSWFERALVTRADANGRRLQQHHARAIKDWLDRRV